jgi:rubrerythrin
MTGADQDFWDDEAHRSAWAYVASLAAAELAVERGQFNTAKVLRAVAHGQRVRALQAARRLAEAHPPAALLSTVLEQAAQAPDAAEPAFSGAVRRRTADVLGQALRGLDAHDEVREADLPQHLWGCYGCGYLAEGDRPEACPACGALGVEFEWFGPFYSSSPEHLGQRTPVEIVATLERVPDQVAAALAGHDDAALRWRPSPEEWSAKEIVAHLLETDLLFARRVQAVLAAQAVPTIDTPVPPWKLHEGKGYDALPGADLLDRLGRAREASLALVRHLTPEHWARRGLVRGAGTSLLDLGTWLANHDRGHLAQLSSRLALGASGRDEHPTDHLEAR